MSKAPYPYAPDEFDLVEPGSGPRGVHRAPRSGWSKAWPFLLVLVVVPVLAYGAVSSWLELRAADPPATASTESSAPAQTPAETPAESAAPEETTAPPPPPPPVETPEPEPEPDLGTAVVVYNSTSRSGLAASAAGVLEDAGWEAVSAANYTGGTLPSSTVRYGSSELEVTARAAAAELGIDTVELDGDVDGIEVVLENDYTP
ncbi:LytR C-terminal domain-containing protein [Cellulomonas fimi]|uniref:LytR C-terminal domain-containing protein n=1 Tax=Cellulomonas fimi TaxID=1708 RepID=A0A7Y0LYA2_CELFI|nr:LytR C-terminal domain-containing protein [Cellulomonas fimi]NMR20305.1 LytR C-terminal domain-containing protein [Cellulomonas fimi]